MRRQQRKMIYARLPPPATILRQGVVASLYSSSSSSSSVFSSKCSPWPVLIIGNPILRQVCSPCATNMEDPELYREQSALVATLEAFRAEHGFGRGIAAPQIGVPKRFIAVNMGEGPRILTNPQITFRSEETFTLFDDCMSLSWLLCKVRRHSSITVRFRNEVGETEVWEKLSRPLSELLQHEIDHLDGILIVDHAEGGGLGIIAREEFNKDPKRFEAEVDYFIEPTTRCSSPE